MNVFLEVSQGKKGSKKTASDPWKGEARGARTPKWPWGALRPSPRWNYTHEAPINAQFKEVVVSHSVVFDSLPLHGL